MKKIVLAFVFLGILFVNSSYSMLNKGGSSKDSNFLSSIKDFLALKLNISAEGSNSLENVLKEEGFFKDFSKDLREGLFLQDPLKWKMDR